MPAPGFFAFCDQFAPKQSPAAVFLDSGFFATIRPDKEVIAMPETVERMTRCGVNLADALEIYDDYMADDDRQGLEAYLTALEAEYYRRAGIIG